MTLLLIRADASPAIGTGHIMRCLAVAEAVADAGGQVAFAAALATDAIVRRLDAAGFPFTTLAGPPGSAADLEATRSWIARHDVDAVLLDGYHFDGAYRAGVRAAGRPVAVFDDLGGDPDAGGGLHADLVINPAPEAADLPYARLAPGAGLLLGPAYAPVRREIREAARGAPVAIASRPAVLLTFGGSDPRGLTLPCLNALAGALPASVPILAVIGGSHPDAAEVARRARQLGGRVEVHVDTPRMGALMARSGLAVSAAGGTVAELAALGVPSLLIAVVDNQVPAVRSLAAAGLCEALLADRPTAAGPDMGCNAATAAAIARAAGSLWRDESRRAAMSEALRRSLDGLGAVRIAERLRALASPCGEG